MLLVTLVAGVWALPAKLWLDQRVPMWIVDDLNAANAEVSVWDDFNGEAYRVGSVEMDHVTGADPCVALRIPFVDSEKILFAASQVKSATELTILNLDPTVSVAGCDFSHLRTLHLGGFAASQLTDWIDKAPNLEDLSIAPSAAPSATPSAALSSEAYGSLAKIKSLSALRLSGATISKGDLAALGNVPGLVHLSLYSCEMDDALLVELSQLSMLNSLQLEGPTVGDQTVKTLRGLTRIHRLSLDSSQLTDSGVKTLSGMSQLDHLSLYDCQAITSRCVPDLIGMQFLDSLNILGTPIEENERLRRESRAILIEWVM